MNRKNHKMEQLIWLAFEASQVWTDLEDEFWEETDFTPMLEGGKWQVLVEAPDKPDRIFDVVEVDGKFTFTEVKE